jgi:enoyl-CoA hydratase
MTGVPESPHDTIALTRPQQGITLVELNRPERLNALTFGMFSDLLSVWEKLAVDPETQVVVVTGNGRGFCAGLDLDDAARLSDMGPAAMLAEQETWARAICGPRFMSKPVIAAVNGPAAGAGFALCLAADIRIASSQALFNAAFVRIGLTGGDCGTSWLLPRIVGLGQASEILMTGRLFTSDYAARIGLVNAVTAPDELLSAAYELADEIRANSPVGVRLTKKVLQSNVDAPSLEAALELENRNQVIAAQTADMSEALTAFRAGRKPSFKGK